MTPLPVHLIDLPKLPLRELLYLRDRGYDVFNELVRRKLVTVH